MQTAGSRAAESRIKPQSACGSDSPLRFVSKAPPGCRPVVRILRENAMPRGDKSAYADKQKRQAAHIEKDYEKPA